MPDTRNIHYRTVQIGYLREPNRLPGLVTFLLTHSRRGVEKKKDRAGCSRMVGEGVSATDAAGMQ